MESMGWEGQVGWVMEELTIFSASSGVHFSIRNSDSDNRLEGSTGIVWKPSELSVGTLMNSAFCDAMVASVVEVELRSVEACAEGGDIGM